MLSDSRGQPAQLTERAETHSRMTASTTRCAAELQTCTRVDKCTDCTRVDKCTDCEREQTQTGRKNRSLELSISARTMLLLQTGCGRRRDSSCISGSALTSSMSTCGAAVSNVRRDRVSAGTRRALWLARWRTWSSVSEQRLRPSRRALSAELRTAAQSRCLTSRRHVRQLVQPAHLQGRAAAQQGQQAAVGERQVR